MHDRSQGRQTRRAGAFLLLTAAFTLAACAGPRSCPAGPERITVIDRGWHTEIGIPADALQGRLAWFRTVYPGARTVVFGYGKRTFILAPSGDLSEYMLGPFPGPAVIQTMGLRVAPEAAWGADGITTLPVSADGLAALERMLEADLPPGRDGHPRLVAAGFGGASLFYAARSAYGPLHTCNSWTASLMKAAGLDVTDWPVAFAGQVMRQAEALRPQRCVASKGAR